MALITVLLIVASILAGEAGGLEARGMEAVACTMQARLVSDEFPDGWWSTLKAYHGWGRPTATSLKIAGQLISGQLVCRNRYVFAMSEEDRRRLGWPIGEQVIARKRQTLHLYSRWH